MRAAADQCGESNHIAKLNIPTRFALSRTRAKARLLLVASGSLHQSPLGTSPVHTTALYFHLSTTIYKVPNCNNETVLYSCLSPNNAFLVGSVLQYNEQTLVIVCTFHWRHHDYKVEHVSHTKRVNKTIKATRTLHFSGVLAFIKGWSTSRQRNGAAASPPCYLIRCLLCATVLYTLLLVSVLLVLSSTCSDR